MSNTKVETLQCCVPVFDPDTLSNEQRSHTGERHDRHNEEQRKNTAHAMAGCVHLHNTAAFKPFVESGITGNYIAVLFVQSAIKESQVQMGFTLPKCSFLFKGPRQITASLDVN